MPRAAPSRPKKPQPRAAIASLVLPIAADIALPALRGMGETHTVSSPLVRSPFDGAPLDLKRHLGSS